MKKMIFVIGIIMVTVLLTGCSSDKDRKTANPNDAINEIVVRGIDVEEIETEEIIVENIETETIETEYIDNEYLKELEYNSQQNRGWN